MRKFKINEWVKCYVIKGDTELNGKNGKVIGWNKDGSYNVQFDYNRFDLGSSYHLKLVEDQMVSLKKDLVVPTSDEVVLIPSGEVIKISSIAHYNLRIRHIITWNSGYNCYCADVVYKNYILKY